MSLKVGLGIRTFDLFTLEIPLERWRFWERITYSESLRLMLKRLINYLADQQNINRQQFEYLMNHCESIIRYKCKDLLVPASTSKLDSFAIFFRQNMQLEDITR